jgi:p-aminobenzoyl-glutamate transporter AbgT
MLLFVSCSSRDTALASQVVDRLRALGHDPWLAPREIRVGEHALRLLTPTNNNSPHIMIGRCITQPTLHGEPVQATRPP